MKDFETFHKRINRLLDEYGSRLADVGLKVKTSFSDNDVSLQFWRSEFCESIIEIDSTIPNSEIKEFLETHLRYNHAS